MAGSLEEVLPASTRPQLDLQPPSMPRSWGPMAPGAWPWWGIPAPCSGCTGARRHCGHGTRECRSSGICCGHAHLALGTRGLGPMAGGTHERPRGRRGGGLQQADVWSGLTPTAFVGLGALPPQGQVWVTSPVFSGSHTQNPGVQVYSRRPVNICSPLAWPYLSPCPRVLKKIPDSTHFTPKWRKTTPSPLSLT